MTKTRAYELSEMADLITPMAIRVAATLRVADYIRDGLRTADEIAEAAEADPDTLDRVMRHLASVDVFDRGDDGRYGLTTRGEWLCDDHPSGLRRMVDVEGALGRADLSAVHMLHSVRTGKAAFPVLYGDSFWDDLAADPGRTSSYDVQMGLDLARWAPHVISGYAWGSFGRVVDVGGGNGTLLAALLEAFGELEGIVFDQPATADAAQATLVAAGVDDRSEVVSGNFFDPLPAGADGYILSAVLHDWNDERAVAILRGCADAAATAGRVFVIEKTGADGESISTAMDLRLLAYFGGHQRGLTELVALATSAGLELVAVHPAGELSIVELAAAAN